MEYHLKTSVFESELSSVQGILDRKPPIPILDNVLLICENGHELKFVATNLDTTLTSVIMTDQVSELGRLCLNARDLYARVKLLPDNIITDKSEDNDWARITVGRSKFRILGARPEDFPPTNAPGFPSPADY